MLSRVAKKAAEPNAKTSPIASHVLRPVPLAGQRDPAEHDQDRADDESHVERLVEERRARS